MKHTTAHVILLYLASLFLCAFVHSAIGASEPSQGTGQGTSPGINPGTNPGTNQGRPFVIFSPPKCGTHLAGKALGLLVDKSPSYHLGGIGNGQTAASALEVVSQEEAEGKFVVTHHFTNQMLKMLVKKGYRIIFVVRDPRDQLVSVANWLFEGQWHWLPVAKLTDYQEMISELITGSQLGWQCVDSCFIAFEKQLSKIPLANVCRVRFEKLVGPHGLGTSLEQKQELLKIAQFLGIDADDEELEAVANSLFGGTKTFRDGSIGKWKQVFSTEQKEQFKRRYASLLKRLGYL